MITLATFKPIPFDLISKRHGPSRIKKDGTLSVNYKMDMALNSILTSVFTDKPETPIEEYYVIGQDFVIASPEFANVDMDSAKVKVGHTISDFTKEYGEFGITKTKYTLAKVA